MKLNKFRVISEGSLPESQAGIFNCGAIADPHTLNQRTLVVRKEKTRDWDITSEVVMFIDKIEKLKLSEFDNVYHLNLVGFPANSKCEDFRLFYYKGEMYAIHTLVVAVGHWSNAEVCKPVISKVTRHSLILQDWCDLPYIKKNRMEKNWLPIVWNDDLYLLYHLDPLRIYKLDGWSWRMVMEADTGLNKYVKGMYPNSSMLSLSAIESIGEDAFLGFWHIREKGVYKQGMFRLDMSELKITHFTPPVISEEKLDAHKPNCLYVSDMVATESTLEIWCGEGDSHTMLIEIEKEEIINTIMASTYNYMAPLKVRFSDKGVGDCICALYAIVGWMEKNPDRGVKWYSGVNHEVISALRIPGITLWMDHNERVDIDLSSNEDYLPYKDRAEYHKKLEGSLKEWYANKLGVKPLAPDTSLIEVTEGYSDAIILFPYSSAWEDRNWHKDNWIELTNRLISAGHRVIVSDQYIARIEKFPGELKVTTSIGEVLSFIKGAKLCVTNESGGAHMAGLLGTKCLVLSGGLDPAKVNDLTKNEFIYKKPLSIITVDEVFDRVTQLLG